MEQQFNRFLKASANPIQDIESLTYEGQDPSRRMYRAGYEQYLNEMPVLDDNDPFLDVKVKESTEIINKLGEVLANEDWVKAEDVPDGGFTRTIVAIESPRVNVAGALEAGKELILAKWGEGFASPVHGHAVGLMHEEILIGKVLLNTFRMKSPKSNVVRPVRTDLINKGTFAKKYTKNNPANHFRRQTLIHSFKAVGFAASLHYIPEHTRDGRDNGFVVEHFDDVFYPSVKDVTRISGKDGMYLRKGDVALVRSENVPEFGDHYIVVTGHPIMKEWGLRPQDVAISAPTNTLLDQFEKVNGLTLLKLNDRAKKAFHAFHNITIDNSGDVIFPEI